MHLGRFQLGQTVPVLFVTATAAGVPTLPTAPPACMVYNATPALVESVRVPTLDRYTTTALFCAFIDIDSAYSAGLHEVQVEYAISGTTLSQTFTFEVLSSGGTDGMAVGMMPMSLPMVDHVVMAGEFGKIKRYRNPRSV